MCRLTGFLLFTKQSYDKTHVIIAMRDTMTYGGPDDAGVYIDDNIAIGHRRLSILDLSRDGRQPMEWRQYIIALNGEIYNFREIRKELEDRGYLFRTQTDTEVLLKGFHHWGVEIIHRCHGMFAFALWDKEKRELYLGRDRMGIKPLYWYLKDNLLMFASELKAFHEHPDFDKSIDLQAVSLFLQQGYIPAPKSVFQYVRKVKAGTILKVIATEDLGTYKLQSSEYDYYKANELLTQKTFSGSVNEAAEKLQETLIKAFQYRLVADVPVGMFLSGGVDSSLLCSLLQRHSNKQLKTFTIGFHDPAFNEAEKARQVAEHIGTDHSDYYCTQEEFSELMPSYSEMYDEPFGDSSGLPTFLVSRLARKEVTVSLSADGADELFGGYSKYVAAMKIYPQIARLPGGIKRAFISMTNGVHPAKWGRLLSLFQSWKSNTNLENKLHKLRGALNATSPEEFFHQSSVYTWKKQLEQLTGQWTDRSIPVPDTPKERFVSKLGWIDLQTYLEGDILTKVDRASMQVALEAREPFLDQDVVSFAMSLPDHLKIDGSQTKILLRKLLSQYVPDDIINRPKQGFAIPVGQWLRNSHSRELQELAADISFHEKFGLNSFQVSQLVKHFLTSERYVNEYFMWFHFVLYQWYRKWML